MKKIKLLIICCFWLSLSFAQTPKAPYKSSKFEQLGQDLPTPNTYRAGDGSPGPEYWQQRADYKITVELNDDDQSIKGSETIIYYNNSPLDLSYIWVQLDQNRFDKNSTAYKTLSNNFNGQDPSQLLGMEGEVSSRNSNGGYVINSVQDANGKDLSYTINETMMRIDLPKPLAAKGGKFTFSIDWQHNIINGTTLGLRGGYEYFPKDDNYIYEIAQWYPRVAVYDDVNGWQNKQYLGIGEFALTFGDFEVSITVPEDHLVGATGELQNLEKVLSKEQQARWEKAKNAENPVLIVNQAEVEVKEKTKAKAKKTWIYKAENVRDFAWTSSRKFIWDAMQVDIEGKKVWAMSYYPKEGNPLWGKYSTQVVAHTLREYSKYTFAYPYPVAISVHGPAFGMEYPMICFNGGRPNPDGTVPDQIRNIMISVIIHEVGHNYFPMIVNSDERQWAWMDEGLNSFLQYLSEVEVPKQEWAKADFPGDSYPSIYYAGPAKNIVPYMKTDPSLLVPIMTTPELISLYGLYNNAYGKPATALNILRETVMGKELFDKAFKEYSQRWKFKHPKPADFFRTLEDASAVDLDWFWRGWFYTTEACDISIEEIELFRFPDPSRTAAKEEVFEAKYFKTPPSIQTSSDLHTIVEQNNYFLNEGEKEDFSFDSYFYKVKFKNVGGLIMPVIIQLNFKDGTNEIIRIPAEIWQLDPETANKVFVTKKEVVSIKLDPLEETADIDTSNNSFPREDDKPSDFQKFKDKKEAATQSKE